MICGVSRVLDLLANTDVRLHQIAYALGYSEPGPLVRAFKRWTDGIAHAIPPQAIGHAPAPDGTARIHRDRLVSCAGIRNDNFRCPAIELNGSRRADTPPYQRGLGRAEFPTIAAPDEDGEDLPRIRSVEVEKGRLPFGLRRVAPGHDDPADDRLFADVSRRLGRGQRWRCRSTATPVAAQAARLRTNHNRSIDCLI